MLMSNGVDAPLELRDLRITTCAGIARVHRDQIHEAMRDGALAFHRDAEGYRVATLDSLVEWMRRDGAAK